MTSETVRRSTADTLTANDTADRNEDGPGHMTGCLTSAILDDFYQCQIHRPDCGHAIHFGSGYLCMSDLRREYSARRQQQEIRQLESLP